MDFEKEIRKVAFELNGKLKSKKEKIFLGGSRRPFETYIIELFYKEYKIIFKNTIGYQASGKVTCELSNTTRHIDFEIDSISHFINLFLRKENRFKIRCNNKSFKLFLNKKALKELSIVSKETAFDPYIFSKKEDDKTIIITEYHLAFENSTYAIKPLFEFYKKVIDYLIQ